MFQPISTLARRLGTLLMVISLAGPATLIMSAADGSSSARAFKGGSDDKLPDDHSGSGSSSGGSSSSSSNSNSGSGSSSSGGGNEIGDDHGSDRATETNDDRLTGGSSNSSSSSTGSNPDSTPGSTASTPRETSSQSTSSRLEGKSKAMVNGLLAEFQVKFERRFDRVKFEAEASNVNLPDGTRLDVCMANALLGTITIGALNAGEFELDSRSGATVPALLGGETFGLHQGGCASPKLLSATLQSPTVTASSVSIATTSDTLLEGKSRRLINGFEAEFSVRLEHRSDRDKFRAEVERLNLGPGTRLDVCFNAQRLGDLFLDALSFGELELDSRRGAPVPSLKEGDVVELRQSGCSGELILAAAMGSTSSTPTGDPSQPQTLRTQLEGKTRRVLASFEAEFSFRFERLADRKKIRAEVSNLNLPEQTHVTVCSAGTALGDIVLNAIHFGELELDSRLGHSVPDLLAGKVIELHRQGCASELLMSVTLAQVQ